MIVRINQFDVYHAEQHSGWPASGRQGAVVIRWPEDTHAFEVLILDRDEQRQPLERSYRQSQIRQLIPQVAEALLEPDETLIVRLDGQVSAGEMLPAFAALSGNTRFGIAETTRFDTRPEVNGIVSVRMTITTATLADLCHHPQFGLDRSVRLRLFSVPDNLVNPLLDINETDDERWEEILPQAGFTLSTTRLIESLHLFSRRYGAEVIRKRLMDQLTGQ